MRHSALLCILNKGNAKHVMERAREEGAPGGTIFNARGTASTTILAALGLADSEKEILLIVFEEREDAERIFPSLLKVKAKGMVLIIDDKEGDMSAKWKLIQVICEKGYSDDIMAAARKAGAKGGTVIAAHGTSTEEDVKFFGSPLVNEKDILMIVAKSGEDEKIIKAIEENEIMRKKGSGVIFSLPVSHFKTFE